MEDKALEMSELLESAQEYIVKLIEGCKKYLRLFNGEEKGDDNLMGMIISIAEGIDWTYKAVAYTQPIQSFPIELDAADDKLNALAEALENIDSSLLADVLEYEMIPMLEDWQEKLLKSA